MALMCVQRSFKGAQNSDESKENIPGGEERGQHVGRPARAPGRFGRYGQIRCQDSHAQACFRRASTLAPACTRSPIFTAMSHSGPKNTSTREPNLIMPT